MDVFMRNVPYHINHVKLAVMLQDILHGPEFAAENRGKLLNYQVTLHRSKRGRDRGHGGTGVLTLPNLQAGAIFLREWGGRLPRRKLTLGNANRPILFEASRKAPRADVLETVRRMPFVDPAAAQQQEEVNSELAASSVNLKMVQTGWECRDGVYSIEWEQEAIRTDALCFDGDNRQLRIAVAGSPSPTMTQMIAIFFSQIQSMSLTEQSGQPIIFLYLRTAPSFELEDVNPHTAPSPAAQGPSRRRLSALFDPNHKRIAPFLWTSLRLICRSAADMKTFRRLCRTAGLTEADEFDYPVERRNRFGETALNAFNGWMPLVPQPVAFQLEAMLRKGSLDPVELVELRPIIAKLVKERDSKFVTEFLRNFRIEVEKDWYETDNWSSAQTPDIISFCLRCLHVFANNPPKQLQHPSDEDTFPCYHVDVTPTAILASGPLPEMTNRVIRTYPGYEENFLRVSFVDEDCMQLRFPREVDGAEFISRRVGGILEDGIVIAGSKFQFLAYSQSALKEHSVWFVTPFRFRGQLVNAASIISSLGTFDGLSYDSRLMYCPARYGARISQAFTATTASVPLETEEIFIEDDISRPDSNGRVWPFTDGVGRMSHQLAVEISGSQSDARPRRRKGKNISHAVQIRFGGSKGMLSIDYRLTGRTLCLRRSMIKFDALDAKEIEIAGLFKRPGRMYLNRPLIMLLEGLGVPSSVFLNEQEKTVAHINSAIKSLHEASRLLENYGLGTSFHIPSALLQLSKLNIDLEDTFYHRMREIALYHIMREIKHHARIPVRGWTLVGVADIHQHLRPREVFVCIHEEGTRPFYLTGTVSVSRSPTIHPGDVQLLHAIGAPPPDSPFAHEALENTIVFSTLGERPLPSYLGGGDLDGDVYNVTDYKPLHILRSETPAEYETAQRKELDGPSTMEDVADFVVDYIISDNLGFIAINWLIIADQSTHDGSRPGIHDPNCLRLAQLHSDAVDYPKSGRAIPMDQVPKLLFKAKPDWCAPEALAPGAKNAKYYDSQRAIGILFRAIKLPEISISRQHRRRNRHNVTRGDALADDLSRLSVGANDDDDPVHDALEDKVSEFIVLPIPRRSKTDYEALFAGFSSELHHYCATNALSHHHSAALSEEEALVGTILAKTSQPRKRKQTISSLREQTALLVSNTLAEIGGGDTTGRDQLKHAWCAYSLAREQVKKQVFGGWGFWWVSLTAIFDAIRSIEEEERQWLHEPI